MKFIGITGGVGCGKSMILKFLESEYGAEIIYSDRLAEELCAPGGECLRMIEERIPDVFPPEVIAGDGSMDRQAMSRVVFSSPSAREVLNGIIHPAVRREIIRIADERRSQDDTDILVLEAALLIEEGYDAVCDELWYVYAPEDVRRERLKEHRDYSDEKIDAIMASQLSDREFRAKCPVVIDNYGTKEECHAKVAAEVRRLLAD